MPRRLIEEEFPFQVFSQGGVKNKASRRSIISKLHIWWARRPLSVSRATALAALLPYSDNSQELLGLVKQVATWERSPDHFVITKAREKILAAFKGQPPRVLDPFAGGGSLPLEALRLGCESHALDYNPVAVLLNKAVLEYPQRFGQWEANVVKANPLLDAVKKWGTWVFNEARQELASFYPLDPDEATPVGYLWAHTVPCANPACGVQIPLLSTLWLVKKPKKKVALRLCLDQVSKQINIEIAHGEAIDFNANQRTIVRANVTCPLCTATLDAKTTRRLFQKGKTRQRLIAIVLASKESKVRKYRLPTPTDLAAFQAAEAALPLKRQQMQDADPWETDPVPDEEIITPCHEVDRLPMYGMPTWGDIFNARQKLTLITFASKVKEAQELIQQESNDSEFTKAVATYLALTLDRQVDYVSTLCRWQNTGEKSANTFDRQALPMIWDYCELNPFSDAAGNYKSTLAHSLKIIDHCSQIPPTIPGEVRQGSATALPYDAEYFDAIFTDPPYYDNVGYSVLSDFFYVWLKRTVGDLHHELFTTPLAPKMLEIVQDPNRQGGNEKAKIFFETKLAEAFQEMYRVLKPDGIAIIVFAHKTTEAWEVVIKALLAAGLYPTASWPIDTEKSSRVNAQDTASMASSIYLVCRKRKADAKVGDYNTVLNNIKRNLRAKLESFWAKGIRGADFFMSAIGPALEEFGPFSHVEKIDGTVIEVAEWLKLIQKEVADFALERVLAGAEVDVPTRFYLLWRLMYGQGFVPFDEAKKLAQSLGTEVEKLEKPYGLVKQKGKEIQLLGPVERARIDLCNPRSSPFLTSKRPKTLIELIQRACSLLETNRRAELAEFLAPQEGQREMVRLVAQGLSEILPPGNKEKQMLQVLLLALPSFSEPMELTTVQGRLI